MLLRRRVLFQRIVNRLSMGATPGATMPIGVFGLEDGHLGKDKRLPDPCLHPFGLQGAYDFLAELACISAVTYPRHVDTQHIIVPTMFVSRRHSRQDQMRSALQLLGE